MWAPKRNLYEESQFCFQSALQENATRQTTEHAYVCILVQVTPTDRQIDRKWCIRVMLIMPLKCLPNTVKQDVFMCRKIPCFSGKSVDSRKISCTWILPDQRRAPMLSVDFYRIRFSIKNHLGKLLRRICKFPVGVSHFSVANLLAPQFRKCHDA